MKQLKSIIWGKPKYEFHTQRDDLRSEIDGVMRDDTLSFADAVKRVRELLIETGYA